MSYSQKVDHAKATALATSGDTPPNLANAARTWNHVTQLGIRDERLLQGGILVVG